MAIIDIGGNIRRLMKLKGFSIKTLAELMNVGTATISNILNGKSEPRSSTLMKFADVLNVQFQDLVIDAPKLENVRFRTNRTLSSREKAEQDQLLISSARWLTDYRELETLLDDYLEFKYSGDYGTNPVIAASLAREVLGLKDPKAPIVDISERFEKAGIKLGVVRFGFKKTYGISVSEYDKGPAIIVNSEPGITIERQLFTMVHELGHLLLHRWSYDGKTSLDDKREEYEANLFAGHFLLPDAALKEEWEDSKGMHWIDSVLRIKRIYKVSYKTVLYRLSQIEPSFELAQLSKRFAIEYQQRFGHDLKNHFEPEAIDDPVARFDPEALSPYEFMETRYANLVRKAYEKGLISISRAGELLKKDALAMRDYVRSWKEMQIHA